MIPHRHIRLAGIPNLRDLGGHKTQCGRQVAHGRLFRCGQLMGLNKDGWSFLQDTGISRIYDFRRPNEIVRTPTTLPTGSKIDIINIAISPGNHGGIANRIAQGNRQSEKDVEREMLSLYRDYVQHCTEQLAEFIHQLLTLDNSESILFHCMAGKDRTGFAAAVLLSCLNVDRQTIEQEYLLTKQYFIPEKEIVRLKQNYADKFNANSNDETINHRIFYPIFDTRLIYLHAALDLIDEQWGSIERYIEIGLKLTPCSREKLQTLFLEPSNALNN